VADEHAGFNLYRGGPAYDKRWESLPVVNVWNNPAIHTDVDSIGRPVALSIDSRVDDKFMTAVKLELKDIVNEIDDDDIIMAAEFGYLEVDEFVEEAKAHKIYDIISTRNNNEDSIEWP
jgi:hypothetical protein